MTMNVVIVTITLTQLYSYVLFKFDLFLVIIIFFYYCETVLTSMYSLYLQLINHNTNEIINRSSGFALLYKMNACTYLIFSENQLTKSKIYCFLKYKFDSSAKFVYIIKIKCESISLLISIFDIISTIGDNLTI